jgi:hypothetical protein
MKDIFLGMDSINNEKQDITLNGANADYIEKRIAVEAIRSMRHTFSRNRSTAI